MELKGKRPKDTTISKNNPSKDIRSEDPDYKEPIYDRNGNPIGIIKKDPTMPGPGGLS